MQNIRGESPLCELAKELNLAISPLLTLLATDATINSQCKYK
ncbi:hypothetical protein EVA_07428 [gut metagenome]|uniref:Uncharacterized protein n=1 Tax=gut metagenome TaxID=749906 RepID=J9GPW7_9ZZZZ